MLTLLKNRLDRIAQAPYSVHSRIHPLNSFNSNQYYVKRDDELGFGVSGSKIRKYRTLIPILISEKFEEIVIIGSLYSNHVLSISQLLNENQINYTLFLRGDPTRELKGNALLLSLLTSLENAQWFSKDEWKNVEVAAKEYVKSKQQKSYILNEGGSVQEALPGALTLPLDIIHNESDHQMTFDHLIIDSGTGLMAIALILGFHFLQRKTKIHVILIAGDEEYFLKQLSFFHQEFEMFMQMKITLPDNFILYEPELSFGKINPSLFEEIEFLARNEGFLTDPIYTAKLFKEARKIGPNLEGNILINHSGGAMSLMGFEERMKKSAYSVAIN